MKLDVIHVHHSVDKLSRKKRFYIMTLDHDHIRISKTIYQKMTRFYEEMGYWPDVKVKVTVTDVAEVYRTWESE